jgi:PAS domain S-box-containing protein
MRDISSIYLRNIVDNLPHYIFWKDNKSKFLGSNVLFARAAGFASPSMLIGKDDFDMPWYLRAKEYIRIDQTIMSSGEAQIGFEEEQPQQDGSIATMLVSKVPMFDQNHDVIGLIGIYMDITDRKQIEHSLLEAKIKAETANQAKTEFLKNMRHDIRTPLNGIIGFAELIKEEDDLSLVKEYAGDLVKSSNALLEYMNEILEVVRITSGEEPMLKQKFDLFVKLESVVDLLRAKAASKKLFFDFEFDASIPRYLVGDPKRTHRIALELLANAITFTEKGYVKLKLAAEQIHDQQCILRLEVEDTGIGIPEEKQQDIFTQFSRLSPAYRGVHKGLGLGLSIVKEFVDELQGEIYVTKGHNKGTRFTCLLPMQIALIQNKEGCH